MGLAPWDPRPLYGKRSRRVVQWWGKIFSIKTTTAWSTCEHIVIIPSYFSGCWTTSTSTLSKESVEVLNGSYRSCFSENLETWQWHCQWKKSSEFQWHWQYFLRSLQLGRYSSYWPGVMHCQWRLHIVRGVLAICHWCTVYSSSDIAGKIVNEDLILLLLGL